MKNTNPNTLANRILSTLKVTDITINALVEKMGTSRSAIYTTIGRLRRTYNITTLNKSTYHLEDGPAALKARKFKSARKTNIESLVEVLSAYSDEYVTKAVIMEYTGFNKTDLSNTIYWAKKSYDIRQDEFGGYMLLGTKHNEVKSNVSLKAVSKDVVVAVKHEQKPEVKVDKTIVTSLVDRIRYLSFAIGDVTTEKVVEEYNLSEFDANRLMKEAGNKYSDDITYVCELSPSKDVRRIGGFVSKEGLTELEVRAWHFVMSLKKCRTDDFAIHFGISPNDAAHLMHTVAEKFEATVMYESYIKLN